MAALGLLASPRISGRLSLFVSSLSLPFRLIPPAALAARKFSIRLFSGWFCILVILGCCLYSVYTIVKEKKKRREREQFLGCELSMLA